MQEASDPSFYLSSDLTHYPAKVYSTPSDSHRSSERFNEFHLSYYHAYGKTEPANDVQTQNPVAWAINQMDSSLDNIAIIFSDLSELQFDSSKLTTAIQTQVFGQGKTIGVLAMKSNFAGLIPMSNGWFIWGSEPTGTLWKMLDYTYYELGISIDPELRQTAQHPLYVICIGESDAVNRFVNTLNSQMNIRFTDEALQLNLRAFDVDFGTKNVNIADSVTLVFNTQEGMNLVDEGKRLRTVTLQRMRGEYDENTNPRYVIYKVTYPGKITDPRTSFGYNPSDFTVSTEIAKREKNNDITPMSCAVLFNDDTHMKCYELNMGNVLQDSSKPMILRVLAKTLIETGNANPTFKVFEQRMGTGNDDFKPIAFTYSGLRIGVCPVVELNPDDFGGVSNDPQGWLSCNDPIEYLRRPENTAYRARLAL